MRDADAPMRGWAAVVLVIIGAVASGGSLYVTMQANAQVAPIDRRVAVLEAQRTEDSHRLERIEQKLDQALAGRKP